MVSTAHPALQPKSNKLIVVVYKLDEHYCYINRKRFVPIKDGWSLYLYKRKIIVLKYGFEPETSWVLTRRMMRPYTEDISLPGEIVPFMRSDIIDGLIFCPFCGKELELERLEKLDKGD